MPDKRLARRVQKLNLSHVSEFFLHST